MTERHDDPRQALLDSLLVERFTPYRRPAPNPPTAEEIARHLRLVIDNTEEAS
jgi:hypothetical protein